MRAVNPTSITENVGLIPGLAQWVNISSIAMVSCGVDCRHTRILVLLWLWCRLVAEAQLGPLDWELLYAVSVALKERERKRERERKKERNEKERMKEKRKKERKKGREGGRNEGRKKRKKEGKISWSFHRGSVVNEPLEVAGCRFDPWPCSVG